MIETRRASKDERRAAARPHLHWFRRVGDDPAGHSGLYACRCGLVRPGL